MKKVYIVYEDCGCIDEIFDTEEKAREYIKDFNTVQKERQKLGVDWETYFSLEPSEVLMYYEEHNVR